MRSWFAEATRLALAAGWEGDGTWLYTVIPDPDSADTAYTFVVKQSNNGTTFVVSQLPFIHLAEYEITPDELFSIAEDR